MADSTSNNTGLVTLDPVQGLVDYTLDVKPYHTKIVEILVEYVHNEIVDVTIDEDSHMMIHIDRPPVFDFDPSCNNGYSMHPYGGINTHLILSPNQNVGFLDYPAINSTNNSVTIPGNISKDLIPGDVVHIKSYVDQHSSGLTGQSQYDLLFTIVGIQPGPAGSAYFEIEDPDGIFDVVFNEYQGSPTTLNSSTFYASGTQNENNKAFVITNIGPLVSGKRQIDVMQAITSYAPIGYLGLIRTVGDINGSYTVQSIEFNPGFIDSWPNYPDVSSYKIGDDPHTIITFEESLPNITYDPQLYTYTATLSLPYIEIESVLSYSNAVRDVNGSPLTISSTPDEGYTYDSLVSVTASLLDVFDNIIPDSGKFEVDGNIDISNVYEGDKLRIQNSNFNNGVYTISSIVYDSNTNTTTVGVIERIQSSDNTGKMIIDIPSNVFVVSGNYSQRFRPGKEFDVINGNYAGHYTVLTSDFNGIKTRVRPTADIIITEYGIPIVDASVGFSIKGDKTGQFTSSSSPETGTSFNVINSETNDGAYTVQSSTFNGTHTIIVPNEPFDNNASGSIVLSVLGQIRESYAGHGYSASSDLCIFSPTEGKVNVKFNERLTFNGLSLDLTDNLIVYNLENTDNNAYYLPNNTIISSVPPTIVEQALLPVSPDIGDLWFNTGHTTYAIDTLHRWTGLRWKAISNVTWLDDTQNILYYRIKTKYADTGWVVNLTNGFGYSDIAASQSNVIVSDIEYFTVGSNGGQVQDTFETKYLHYNIAETVGSTLSNQPHIIVDGNVQYDVKGLDLTHSNILTISNSVSNDGTYTLVNIEYDEVNDQSLLYVVENVSSSTSDGEIEFKQMTFPVLTGSPLTFDETLVKVYINDIPASFDIINETTFILTDLPTWRDNDTIKVVTYSVTTNNITNVNVETFDAEPHIVYHSMVDAVELSGSPSIGYYNVYGGNFIDRFVASNKFDVIRSTAIGGMYPSETMIDEYTYGQVTQYAKTLNIIDVDDQSQTITVSGDYTWAFTTGNTFAVKLSVTNTQHFQVGSLGSPSNSYYDNVNDVTVIPVLYPNVYETPSESSLDLNQHFFNPGVQINEIDNVSDTIEINGVIADVYTVGSTIKIENSTTNNNSVYTVQSINYAGSPLNTTIIKVAEDISDPDSTGNATLHTPIHQNYTKDLGVIIGALYNPNVNASDENDQVKTIVIPNGDIVDNAARMSYKWYGPMRMELDISRNESTTATFNENIISDTELLVLPCKVDIVSTDATTNTIRVHYSDQVSGSPINIEDSYNGVGSMITITDSSGNNAEYGVKSVIFDPGTGDNIIEVEDNFDNLPPYTTFTVVDIVNTNPGSPNLPYIEFSGDVRQILLPQGNTKQYRIDQPLVSNFGSPSSVEDMLSNILTITGVDLIGGNTIAYIDNYIIDDSYTGNLSMMDAKYRDGIYYDSTNTTGFTNGSLLRECVSIDDPSATIASTAFEETLNFGWGTTHYWTIDNIDIITNTIYIVGDVSTMIHTSEDINISGSDGVDGTYNVDSVIFNGTSGKTEIVVTNGSPVFSSDPSIFGTLMIQDVDITNWYQYNVIQADSVSNIFTIYGNATFDIQVNQMFKVLSTLNDGVYTALNVTYDSQTNLTSVEVSSITNDSTGGWIESYRDYGIRLILEDSIGIAVAEESTGSLILSSGDLVDAWDYNFWDVGTFDGSSIEIVHLYSSST